MWYTRSEEKVKRPERGLSLLYLVLSLPFLSSLGLAASMYYVMVIFTALKGYFNLDFKGTELGLSLLNSHLNSCASLFVSFSMISLIFAVYCLTLSSIRFLTLMIAFSSNFTPLQSVA